MNKAQFVEAIALDANISKIDARKAVDAMIRVTVQSLREGERLTLTGLGTFSVQQKSERVGRNPSPRPRRVSNPSNTSTARCWNTAPATATARCAKSW